MSALGPVSPATPSAMASNGSMASPGRSKAHSTRISSGHNAYADAIQARLGEGVAPEDAGEGGSRVIEGPCVPGSAPTFSLPDLLGARSLGGARDIGLDPTEIEALAHQLYDGLAASREAAVLPDPGVAVPRPD